MNRSVRLTQRDSSPKNSKSQYMMLSSVENKEIYFEECLRGPYQHSSNNFFMFCSRQKVIQVWNDITEFLFSGELTL